MQVKYADEKHTLLSVTQFALKFSPHLPAKQT